MLPPLQYDRFLSTTGDFPLNHDYGRKGIRIRESVPSQSDGSKNFCENPRKVDLSEDALKKLSFEEDCCQVPLTGPDFLFCFEVTLEVQKIEGWQPT